MSLDPKASKKFPLGWSKKQQVSFKNLKWGKQHRKKRLVGETSRENTKYHLDIP